MLDKFDKDSVDCSTCVRTGLINSPVDKFDKDNVECSTCIGTGLISLPDKAKMLKRYERQWQNNYLFAVKNS